MESLVLSRQVKLEKYEAVMEIGRQQRREELHAVLLLAEEHGGVVTAREVSQELLQGRPELVGKAIVDRCRDLGLLDESGRITAIGRDALQTGNVFIPERGRYVVWFTEDPLVPQKLIHLEAKEESHLSVEVAIMKDRNARAQTTEAARPLPDKLRSLEGGVYNLMGKGGGKVVIRTIDANGLTCHLGPADSAKLTLQVGPASSRLAMSGGFERLLTPPSLDFEDAWVSALGPLAKFWARSRDPPALRSTFDELNAKELTSFSKTVLLSQPSLKGYGEFDDTSVDDVPIIPRTSSDAASWARWLLKRSIDRYMDDERYQRLVESCKSRFPDFPGIKLPAAEEVVHELGAEKTADGVLPKAYWYVQAPLDLKVAES
jgi:hypothetical protein